MLTSCTLLAIAGGVCRIGLSLVILQRYGHMLSVPQVLAGTLVVLAGLPDLLQPVPFPLPLSLTLGFLLPDLILARRV